jgi:hypothetical protein
MSIHTLALLCLVTSCAHLGQRLLHIEIECDGDVVFTGMRGVRDDMPVEEMWNTLSDVPFELAADSTVTVTGEDEQTCKLTGNVVVRIKHVESELAAISLSSISLTRNEENDSWSLSKDQSEQFRNESAQAKDKGR